MSEYRIVAIPPAPPDLTAVFLMNVDARPLAWQATPVVSLAIVEWQDADGFHSEVDGIVVGDKLRPARFTGRSLVGYRYPNVGTDWDAMAATMRLAIERPQRLAEEHRQPADYDPTANLSGDPDRPIGRPGPPPVPPEKKDDEEGGCER